MKIKRYFRKIKRSLQIIVNVQVRIILSIVYFIIITPVALVVGLFGDPLGIKGPDVSWKSRHRIEDLSEFLRRQ